MKIDLSQLRIEFPEKPTWAYGSRRDYHISGYFSGLEVGHITLAMLDSSRVDKDDFWFENRSGVWVPRPLVFFQSTKLGFFGQGINGKLLTLLNEETKKRYQMPLVSSTNFLPNALAVWRENDYAERPAKRVWEKLEEQGLAYRKDFEGKSRWVMK